MIADNSTTNDANILLRHPPNIARLKDIKTGYITIYCIQNTENGKLYVGQTSQSLKRRLMNHKARPNKRMKADVIGCKTANKDFFDVFKVYILGVVQNSAQANAVETKMIRRLESNKVDGYNDVNIVGHPFCKGMYQQLYKRKK